MLAGRAGEKTEQPVELLARVTLMPHIVPHVCVYSRDELVLMTRRRRKTHSTHRGPVKSRS